jgi:hypothetical protein
MGIDYPMIVNVIMKMKQDDKIIMMHASCSNMITRKIDLPMHYERLFMNVKLCKTRNMTIAKSCHHLGMKVIYNEQR